VGRVYGQGFPRECSISPLAITPWTSESELTQLVTGQWLACMNSTIWPAGSIGIEVRADQTFVMLIVDAGGRIARGPGVNYSGTWVFTDAGTGNGPLALGIRFDTQPGGGTWVARPVFTESPTQMKMGDILGQFTRPSP
jgi:hypothetical protein